MSQLLSRFDDQHVSGEIRSDDLIHYVVKGYVKSGSCMVRYWAASPPDLRQSYSGSGLPFPNPEIAFDGTPNRGTVKCNRDGLFEIRVIKPNGYYVGQGTRLIGSQLKLALGDSTDVKIIQLGNPVENRSLTHLEGRPVRSYGR